MDNNVIDLGLEGSVLPQIRDLNKELLVLRLSFGKLKAAIADAAAPVAAVLVPALTKAVGWATRLARSIGAVISALLGIQVHSKEVTTSVRTAGKAIKRSLASFDEIQRLEGNSGSSVSTQQVTLPVPALELSEQLQQIVDRIRALLAPLLAIDFVPLQQSLAALGRAFSTFGTLAGQALEQFWYEILTPFIAWVVEEFAPAFLNTFSQALQSVTTVLSPLIQGFGQLWQALQPVVSFIGETVIWILDLLGQSFSDLSLVFSEKGQVIVSIFSGIGQIISSVWTLISPVLTGLREHWAETFTVVSSVTASALGAVLEGLNGVIQFLAGTFTGDWGKAWNGIKDLLKFSVNGILGLINVMLAAVTGAVNSVIRVLNKLSFPVPDWVPGIGGQTFGFNIKPVTVPQIPYLAKGAVLPANKPFMAVVGDQRHGTNIEAPLTTIQEAVALVMGDQLGALQAGFDATVRELQQLRGTVAGIQVGDTVIGMAAQRYNQKMAVMRGGPV